MNYIDLYCRVHRSIDVWVMFNHFRRGSDVQNFFRWKRFFIFLLTKPFLHAFHALFLQKMTTKSKLRIGARCSVKVTGWWITVCQRPHQQFTCRVPGCKTKTHNYCKCAISKWICESCHTMHVAKVVCEEIIHWCIPSLYNTMIPSSE